MRPESGDDVFGFGSLSHGLTSTGVASLSISMDAFLFPGSVGANTYNTRFYGLHLLG